MKILIIGSCRNNDSEHKRNEHKKLAEDLGKELALRGHEIISGGAGGLQGVLASSFKKNNGKKWTVYLASGEKNDKDANPPEGIIPDEEIQTEYNYSIRDAFYIGKCDGVLALSGKLLTFAEIILAVKNYHKKVFQLEIGENLDLIKNSIELKDKVLISADIKEGLDFLDSS
jgi:uncharacterized protein (TIGR00725 family)